MAEQCYLGVDLGAESGRVMAGLFDGSRISLEELHRFPNAAVEIGGSLRWNVLALWGNIARGLAAAASAHGKSVASIGVDTWGVDYVLLSKTGEILGQPVHYRDGRTHGILEYAFTRVRRRDIFAETGLQFLEFNTLFQLIAMQKNNGDLLRLADKLLMMPDFFHWCLCGSRVVEFTNATTTQCFHPVRGGWAYELLRRFGLPTHIFPEVVMPGTKLGRLREQVANSTGLDRQVEVIAPATHDTGAAVAAVPTERTGKADWAYISSGTWSLMGVEVREAMLTDRALELNVTNEGGIDGTYRLLKNIMGLWLVQECRRSFNKHGREMDYAELIPLAMESRPFRSLIEPDNGQFLKPDDMPTAIRDWCRAHDQPVPESPGELVRCALESLALKYRRVLDWLQELTKTEVEVIHIVGGGSQNELLNQFTANACGKPVIAGPVEATVLGNVLVQARAAGEVGTLGDIREVVRMSYDLKHYEPRDVGAWQQAYERFAAVIRR